jgi:hypothetical protein
MSDQALTTIDVQPAQAELIERPISFGSLEISRPGEVVQRAAEIATALKSMVLDRKLSTNIKGRDYVHCEGWTTMGAMLGVVPREVETHENAETPGEFIARVELVRAFDCAVIGGASASCGPDEREWAGRTRQARRSMALTRATSKAFRLAFSWVMKLAGYEATPFEEIGGDAMPDLHDNPEQAPGAPVTPTRQERAKPAAQAVAPETIGRLGAEWKTRRPDHEASKAHWLDWLAKVTGSRALNKADKWTTEHVRLVEEALQKELG